MALPGVTFLVPVAGARLIIRVQELAAVPGSALGEPIGSLAAHRDEIKRALDILIDGV